MPFGAGNNNGAIKIFNNNSVYFVQCLKLAMAAVLKEPAQKPNEEELVKALAEAETAAAELEKARSEDAEAKAKAKAFCTVLVMSH